MEPCTQLKNARTLLSKLVRDNMIEKITSQGGICSYQILNKQKYLIYLKKKLLEESKEIVKTKGREDLIEELCDFYDVFMATLESYNITLETLLWEYYRNNKNGQLSENLFLNYIIVLPDQHDLIDFFSQMGTKEDLEEGKMKFLVKKMVFDDFPKKFSDYELEITSLETRSVCYELKKLLVYTCRMVLSNTKGRGDLMKGLGQMYVIFSKILTTYNMPLSDIIKVSIEKCSQDGGFKKRIFLHSIETTKDSQLYEYLNKKYKTVEVSA